MIRLQVLLLWVGILARCMCLIIWPLRVNNVRIRTVHPIEAASKFADYESDIVKALKHDFLDDTTTDDARELILLNEWQVHEIYENDKRVAICCTEFHRRKHRPKILNVVVLGGRGLNRWQHELVEYLTKFAKGMSCSAITCYGRHGWARALSKEDFKLVSQVMMKEV